jgi:hypothetical protein
MSGCGRILAPYPNTLPKCGGFWYGEICYCKDCEDKDLDREYKRAVIKLAEQKAKAQGAA